MKAGAALGMDRLVLLLTKSEALACNQPFPQTDDGKEFFGGPNLLSVSELQDLGIEFINTRSLPNQDWRHGYH